ncbi:MAG: Hsp20/alpha crystallin family protein [Planctomycetota bacterium]
MSLIRWRSEENPFPTLQQEMMNRLFPDYGQWGRGAAPAPTGRWAPAIDVTETPETFVVETEVPGIDPKDVEISVIGDTLTLKGEKTSTKETKDVVRHHVERTYGAFSRSVTLPAAVDPDRLSATSEHGILTITLGKREEVKPRRITVKAQ